HPAVPPGDDQGEVVRGEVDADGGGPAARGEAVGDQAGDGGHAGGLGQGQGDPQGQELLEVGGQPGQRQHEGTAEQAEQQDGPARQSVTEVADAELHQRVRQEEGGAEQPQLLVADPEGVLDGRLQVVDEVAVEVEGEVTQGGQQQDQPAVGGARGAGGLGHCPCAALVEFRAGRCRRRQLTDPSGGRPRSPRRWGGPNDRYARRGAGTI